MSEGFRSFALDQLSSVPGLRARPMFGGFGLYAGDTFFGILAADVLYLKVDDSNRADYQKSKAPVFQPFKDGQVSMSYYAVPLSVLESQPLLAVWARRSIVIASAGKKAVKPASRSKSTSKK